MLSFVSVNAEVILTQLEAKHPSKSDSPGRSVALVGCGERSPERRTSAAAEFGVVAILLAVCPALRLSRSR